MPSDPSRFAKDILTVIGFVTAVVSFGKLLASGWSSVPDVLTWAGVVYATCALGACVYGVFILTRRLRWPVLVWFGRIVGTAAMGFSAFGFSVAWLDGDRRIFSVCAAIGLTTLLPLATYRYLELHRSRAELFQVCPDCAEKVRAVARVCKYCGYRFVQQ